MLGKQQISTFHGDLKNPVIYFHTNYSSNIQMEQSDIHFYRHQIL